MISQTFFFIKTIILTLFIAALLQISFQGKSLDSHLMTWVATSPILEPLRTTAISASHLLLRGWEELRLTIEEKKSSHTRTETYQKHKTN